MTPGLFRHGLWLVAAPTLWVIGDFEFREFAVNVILAPNVVDLGVFDDLNCIRRETHGHQHGTVILTNYDWNIGALIMSDCVGIVQLDKCITISDAGLLSAYLDAIAEGALHARFLDPPRAGRHVERRELAARIIADLDRKGLLEGLSGRKQHQGVLAVLRKQRGAESTLSRSVFSEAPQLHRTAPTAQ